MKDIPKGYYLDAEGQLRPDRRRGFDRRVLRREEASHHEQRKYFRRQADRELYERDHKAMIKEALEDFAEDHGGRL